MTATSRLLPILLIVCQTSSMSFAAGPDDMARRMLADSGVRGGLIVHLGCGDGRLTAALRVDDGYVVHGLAAEPGDVETARQYIQSLRRYGDVSVDALQGRRLPYADNLVNLMVVEDPTLVPRSEVMRALAPLGIAMVRQQGRWTKTQKPWPEEIDEWTHHLHDADGNAVANDLQVGPPRHVQWIAEPRWQRHHEMTPSLNALVSAGGRLFAIINEAPPGIDGLPDRWTLVARDAFNGKLLWKRPIAQWGWKYWGDHSYGHGRWNLPTHIARRLVAIGDRVYVTLGFNAPLTALDAATGKTLMTYDEADFAEEILYRDGTLFLSVNTAAQGPGHIAEKPPVEKAIVAIDAKTGRRLWRTEGFIGAASKADAIERVTHLTMVLGRENVFLAEDDAIVALDLKTGKRMWRKERPPRPRPVTYGHYYFTNLCSLTYHDGMVFFIEPDPKVKSQPWNAPAQGELLAMAETTGDVLWTRPCGIWGHYNPGDIFAIDELVWVHDGKAFAMMGIDPSSGEVKRRISTEEALDQGHHHRCYRNKATSRYFVTGRRGTEFIDIESEENLRHHWVRGTCRYGVLPCNGLLYAPPHPCICYITSKLNGFWALAPQRSETQSDSSSPAFQRGPAYEQDLLPAVDEARASGDWPTYRHDAARSGHADTKLPDDLEPQWKIQLDGKPTSPVIAGGKVFVAVSDAHTMRAFDAADGTSLWSYTTGGRIDTPPTIYRGLALFGSADGCVYCLNAADGKLLWRRRAATDDSRILSHGQLESPWPVHGSVLVQDGVAYYAAGRSSFLDGGIIMQAVDPATGKLLQERRIDSLDPKTRYMVEARLPYDMPPESPGALPDVLVGDGTSVFMRHLQFDPADLSYRNSAEAMKTQKKRSMFRDVGGHLMSGAGLLDDCWFNQTYWTVDGKSQCKLLVFDDETAYGIKPFASNARHSRAIFRPGTEGYTLFSARRPNHSPGQGSPDWSRKIPIRAMAMVVAGERLFVAGPPDVVIPDDPWAALDGRLGALLRTVSTVDGKRIGEVRLDAPPVFDGMAAADGRIYVSLADGQIICLGQ